MLLIPRTDHAAERTGSYDGNSLPCVCCGKSIHAFRQRHYVRLFWGTHAVTKTEADKIITEEGTGGDLGYYPVGANCLKRFPELKPYVQDAKLALVTESKDD